jgi:hypothetical protein
VLRREEWKLGRFSGPIPDNVYVESCEETLNPNRKPTCVLQETSETVLKREGWKLGRFSGPIPDNVYVNHAEKIIHVMFRLFFSCFVSRSCNVFAALKALSYKMVLYLSCLSKTALS